MITSTEIAAKQTVPECVLSGGQESQTGVKSC